jgi:hypothetical protein
MEIYPLLHSYLCGDRQMDGRTHIQTHRYYVTINVLPHTMGIWELTHISSIHHAVTYFNFVSYFFRKPTWEEALSECCLLTIPYEEETNS